MPAGILYPPGRPSARKRTAVIKIQRAFRANRNKLAKRRVARMKPRQLISKNPLSKPNVYNFMRSYAYNCFIGVADAGNEIYMNTDNKAQIIKLRVKASKIPAFNEFVALFNQYQITSVCSRLVPFYKDNVAFTKGDQGVVNDYGVAIPNFQVFYMPENYTIDLPDLASKNITQIDEYINQAQKKTYRMFPSKQKTLWNKRPSIPDVIYDAKAGNVVPSSMVTAPYIDCDDQNTEIYGLQLVIMRVDRLALNAHNNQSNIFQHMGWRIQNDIYFRTRKVE